MPIFEKKSVTRVITETVEPGDALRNFQAHPVIRDVCALLPVHLGPSNKITGLVYGCHS